MNRQQRGQLTLVDVIEFVAAFAVLAALGPVVYVYLSRNAGDFRMGTVMLFQILVPSLVVTMLVIMFAIAVGGGN